jgi:Glycosyl hydrolases family 2, TIM barrel domain/Glycosyl hydrolases family 2, sugar binding domain/Glycosyl hydrolases family 2
MRSRKLATTQNYWYTSDGMLDRRNFLGRLGASAALTAIPALSANTEPRALGTRTRISLSGDWGRQIGGERYDTVTVPSSLRPTGNYILERKFQLARLTRGQRAFVHFEAIAFWGRVVINGEYVGTTSGPYVPAEFEFTHAARDGQNSIQVQIVDLTPLRDGRGTAEVMLGHNPGWEASGGIIRDAWVETRPAAFVENVRFAYTLNSDYSVCSCNPHILVSSLGEACGTLEIALQNGQIEVGRAAKLVELKAGPNEVELAFQYGRPMLWSPEFPNLYKMTVSLKTSREEDTWTGATGFRDIRTNGRGFLLNGKPLILKGVCRHDMWPGEGFTLNHRQQEQDMRMIKSMGCNFVRLVHYPHDRRIIELADQMGLLVSEEPGFWQVDFATAPRPPIEMGFRILEGVVRRDWNSPSVMIWFVSNECTLTEAFLKESKERCNRLDSIHRLVAPANDHSSADVKPLFVSAGMDFFDQHPYTHDPEDFAKEAHIFGGSKPLTFSEWGGKGVGQSESIMRTSVDRLIDLTQNSQLAGTMFWSWQDVREYSRIDDEMNNGVLESGVVTEERTPRTSVVKELNRLFELRRQADERGNHTVENPIVMTSPDSMVIPSAGGMRDGHEAAPERPTVLPLRTILFASGSNFQSIDLQPFVESPGGKRSWKALEAQLEKCWGASRLAADQWERTGRKFELWKNPEVQIGGVAFRSPLVNGVVRPLVITPEDPEVEIPIRQPCERLHFLGQVAFGRGYPVSATPDLFGNIPSGKAHQFGDVVAEYTLQFAGEKTRTIPVRNGIEVAQANRIYEASRILPIALSAQPALEYIKDIVREQYQVLLWSILLERKYLERVRCKLTCGKGNLAIFAITTEIGVSSR